VLDEPIRARRPTLGQRLRKWTRRHQAVMISSLIVLLVSVLVLAGNIGWALRDRQARRTATTAVVEQALDESIQWQKQRRVPEAFSAALRAAGLVAGGEADEALKQRVAARMADLSMLQQLDDARLEAAIGVKDDSFDQETIDERYRTTFHEAGLGV